MSDTDYTFEDSTAFAASMDAQDELADFREEFIFPDWRKEHAPVYLCGNSLGLQSRASRTAVEEELNNWATYAVDGHFHSDRPWMSYHRLAASGFASLCGASEREVIAMNTLTVNLHLLMASFYKPDSGRYKIVIEKKAFPSDQYAAASQLQAHGFNPVDDLLEWEPRGRDGEWHLDDLAALLDEHGDSVALLLLPGVQYYTGQVFDMDGICELGRRHGCAVGLDLAHAIGNVPLKLSEWSPDFACWCTYKYLNAGPGAIAGAFVPERHFADALPLQGWWGNAEETRFKMLPRFDPADGAEQWQMSNPPILSLAPVVASLDQFERAQFSRLLEKSSRLTAYLEWLVEQRFDGQIESITPRHAQGCQSSLKVIDPGLKGRVVFDALCRLNVTGDWREPDVIRIAPAPMYNSFSDVFEFANRLETAIASARG